MSESNDYVQFKNDEVKVFIRPILTESSSIDDKSTVPSARKMPTEADWKKAADSISMMLGQLAHKITGTVKDAAEAELTVKLGFSSEGNAVLVRADVSAELEIRLLWKND